ncbi:MAG: hypothetical protein C4555_03470, partial [Dehalococcoidia bacterium]
KSRLAELDKPRLKPSEIYRLLGDYTPATIIAGFVTASDTARRHAERYLTDYRHVRSALNGKDLLALGIKPGPDIKKTLDRLRDARLDAKATDRRSEIALVKRWLRR